MVSTKDTGLQLVVSDQSGSRLKECPRTADPDQRMVTAPGSSHHPAGGAADPWPATSCFSGCVWWWHFPLRLSLPFHSIPRTCHEWESLMNGMHLHIYFKKNWQEQNLLLTAGVAVSEVSFIHVSVDGQEGLLQHREGTAQSSSLSGCRAHTTDWTVPMLLSQPAVTTFSCREEGGSEWSRRKRVSSKLSV